MAMVGHANYTNKQIFEAFYTPDGDDRFICKCGKTRKQKLSAGYSNLINHVKNDHYYWKNEMGGIVRKQTVIATLVTKKPCFVPPGTLSVHAFCSPWNPCMHFVPSGTLSVHTFCSPWNPVCPYSLFPLEPCLSIHCVAPGTLSVHTFCSPWNPVCPYSLFPLEPCLSIHFVPLGALIILCNILQLLQLLIGVEILLQ